MSKRLAGTLCAFAWALLTPGCSGSAHSSARRDYYAQAACTDTVSCCLQKSRGNPEACGLTASEAATLMAGGQAASNPAEWDDSHNESLPEWKRRCIRAYGDCQDGLFSGPCYDCMRRCEGQHEWPIDMCEPKRKRK
nr:hypothetical protein [Myxococcus sp. AS-1-15]